MDTILLKNLKLLFFHLPKEIKLRTIATIFLMMAASIFDLVSLGTVVPFLTILIDPSVIDSSEALEVFLNFFGFYDKADYLEIVSLMFISAVIISIIVRVFTIYFQMKTVHLIGQNISTQMYRKVLYQPYNFHVNANNNELITTISVKSDLLIKQLILPISYLINAIFLIGMILSALFFINYKIALSSISFFGAVFLFLSFLQKKRVKVVSENISTSSTVIIKTIKESLSGIREVIIDNTFDNAIQTFDTHNNKFKMSQATSLFFAQSPRPFVEGLGIIFISSLGLILTRSSGFSPEIFGVLAAFTIGAQKMLPAAQNAYGSLVNLKTFKQSFGDIIDILQLSNESKKYNKSLSNSKINFEDQISIDSGYFRYNFEQDFILKNINFSVKRGDFIGIIGETGSGKSTFVDVLMGLMILESGSYKIDDKVIKSEDINSLHNIISHVPQSIFLFDTTVYNNITISASSLVSEERLRKVTEVAELTGVIGRLERGFNTSTGDQGILLSGGEKQRIGIARALYKESSILILDEATSALDFSTEIKILDNIKDFYRDKTIIMISHRNETLKKCDKVFKVSNGTIKSISI